MTGVGDLGAAILAATPEAAKAAVEPFVPAIVDGHPRRVVDRDVGDVHARDRGGGRGRRAGAAAPRGTGPRRRAAGRSRLGERGDTASS